MSTTLLQMGKMNDKMRQDGAKLPKMRDVSSVLGPSGRVRHRPGRQHPGEPGPWGVPPNERILTPSPWVESLIVVFLLKNGVFARSIRKQRLISLGCFLIVSSCLVLGRVVSKISASWAGSF